MDEAQMLAFLEQYFQSRYKVSLSDLEASSVPGYWKRREPCKGWPTCREPLHGTLFNRGGVRHTVSYFDSSRDFTTGRFISTTRTWQQYKRYRAACNVIP